MSRTFRREPDSSPSKGASSTSARGPGSIPGSLERYYNDDPEAVAIYEREVKQMLAEDLGAGEA
jgi:hypothetical protein